jgi:hypothetical protein
LIIEPAQLLVSFLGLSFLAANHWRPFLFCTIPLVCAISCCAVGAFLSAANVLRAPPPTDIRLTVHDISPGLERQLVLELKVGKAGAEVVEVLPRHGRSLLLLPLDKHLTDAAGQPTSKDATRGGHYRAIESR